MDELAPTAGASSRSPGLVPDPLQLKRFNDILNPRYDHRETVILNPRYDLDHPVEIIIERKPSRHGVQLILRKRANG
jgi:hypothetical protein